MTPPLLVIQPPRKVPWRAKCSLFIRFHSQLAAFMLFLTLFVAVICLAGYEPDLALLQEDSPRVAGRIDKVVTLPGTHRKTATTYDYHYSYQVRGLTYRGQVNGNDPDVKEITVQYAAETPAVSRVDGFRRNSFPRGLLVLPLVFLLLTVYLFFRALQETVKDVRLIREGCLAHATVERSTTPGRPEITLNFSTLEGEAWQYCPTGDNSDLEDGFHQIVMYVPGRPRETKILRRLDHAMQAMFR